MVLEMVDETTSTPEQFVEDNAGDEAVADAVAELAAGTADEVPVGFFVLRIARC